MNKKNNQNDCQTEIPTIEDFRNFVRFEFEARVRILGIAYARDLLEEEVESLCGRKGEHKKRQGLAHRGGSEETSLALFGQRVGFNRPRVRKDGKEIHLERYAELANLDNLGDTIFKMILQGVSTRGYPETVQDFPGAAGISKSSVSRQFVKESRGSLNELNSRRFPNKKFWALFMDGIEFGGSMVIAALGVDTSGKKHILGLAEGSSENAEVCKSLLENIVERKIQFTEKFIAVVDGSKALKKAIKDVFGKRVKIQRCWFHKRKNIEAKLAEKYHMELRRRLTQANSCESYEDARESLQTVLDWLRTISHAAAESLEEAFDDLLTLHEIKMPGGLRKSLYTTNVVESPFSPMRYKTNRVKKWRRNTDQVQRWAASHLLYQEKKFRRVKGYKLIQGFLEKFLGDSKKILAEKIAV